MVDIQLVQEAGLLATGADVHDVEKALIWYRRTDPDADQDAAVECPYVGRNRDKIHAIWEQYLRRLVVEKKLARLGR